GGRRVAGRAGGVDLSEALRDAPGAPLPPAQPFALRKVVFDEDWDLLGFVGWSPALKAVVVAFRGTDSRSVYNWASNMRTWRTDLALAVRSAPPGALVHGGFFLSYNSSSLAGGVTEAVLELLDQHPGAPVYATGHSMGGALATICALDLRLSHDLPDVRLYTYGSPRVGNAIFQAWVLEVVKEHWRFTHNRDLVPSVPPVLMGFSHLARELWMVDYAAPNCTLVGYCDDSGEDVLCHNSVCHLGLCSSIADHLVYLSPMFTPHPQGC
ncbi:triglyceride lipase, partial [Helicosporidium sp. ATCC 50920]